MDPFLSPYELLRVRPDVTSADIRAAYRRLAVYYHPGRKLGCPSNSPELYHRINVFTLLAVSLDTLLDPKLRRKVDEEYGTLTKTQVTERNAKLEQESKYELPLNSLGRSNQPTNTSFEDFLDRITNVRQGLPLPDPYDVFYREFNCHLGGENRTISSEKQCLKDTKLVPNVSSSIWTGYTHSNNGLVVTTRRVFPHRTLTRTEIRKGTTGNSIRIVGEEPYLIQKSQSSRDKQWCDMLGNCSLRWNVCGDCMPYV